MASIPLKAAARAPQRPSPPPRPLPQGVIDRGNRYTLAQRIQCLTLLTEGFSAAQVEQRTGVKERQQRNIKKKAYERGFRPQEDPRILEAYVVDSERSGRLRVVTQNQEDALLATAQTNHSSKEKSSEVLAYEQGISYSSALRFLHKLSVKQRETHYQAWPNCGNAEDSL
jgi:transposase